MTRKTSTEQLPVKLTDPEKSQKSDQLAIQLYEIEQLEKLKQNSNSSFALRIKEARAKVARLSHEVRTSEEQRPVKCYEKPIFADKIVELIREDTEAVVSTRGMHPSELQHQLQYEGDLLPTPEKPMPRDGDRDDVYDGEDLELDLGDEKLGELDDEPNEPPTDFSHRRKASKKKAAASKPRGRKKKS